jgi:hypothetical protein
MILISMNISAQNLVPNPSFEDMDYCPFTLTQIDAASGWYSCNAIGTPDYYNICSSVPGLTPPTTFFTYQNPFDGGNGFVGIYNVYISGANPEYREIIGTELSSSLQTGIKYYVSFYLNKGGGLSNYDVASNKIGVLFSTIPFNSTNPAPLNNFAHVYSDSIISDTLNWVLIADSFIADSAYNFISIGNFFDSANTDTLNFGNPLSEGSYYLFENICVSSDSNLCGNQSFIQDYQSDIILTYPNPVNNILNISLGVNNKNFQKVLLYNSFGQKIYYSSLADNISNLQMNFQSLTNGIYILEIESSKSLCYKKICVHHY